MFNIKTLINLNKMNLKYNDILKEKKYFTIKEISKILEVSPLTLRIWDKSGKLKALRNPLNNYRVYSSEDIENFLEKNKPTIKSFELQNNQNNKEESKNNLEKTFYPPIYNIKLKENDNDNDITEKENNIAEDKKDIIIPEKNNKKENIESPTQSDNDNKKNNSQNSENKKNNKKSWLLKIFFVLIFFLIPITIFIFLISLYNTNLKIKIWPKTEIISFEKSITVKEGNYYDFSKNILPGQTLKINENLSKEFSSTGKIPTEKKATGIIRVYNNHSIHPQALLSTTRFISLEGKMFRSLKYNIVPGQRYENEELIPGFIDIEVIASESGDDYNIGPSQFSIPGFVDTYKENSFYGKSFQPMEGGFKGDAGLITETDIKEAEKNILEELKKNSKEELIRILPENFTLIEESIIYKIEKKECSKDAEEITEKFSCFIEVSAIAFIVSNKDIKEFIKESIIEKVSEKNNFQEDNININYLFKNFNEEENKIDINVFVEAKIYSEINIESLKENIYGKNLKDIKSLLEDSKIRKIEIDKGIPWRKNIPQNTKKIEIILMLD